jgi:hypothetical protein
MSWWAKRSAAREASRESKEEARRLAGTTRHLELPVSPDEALVLLKEAADLRTPMMRLLRYTDSSATVSVAGSYGGQFGTGGNIGAGLSAFGGGIGIKVTWAPLGQGTEFTAYASSIGAMMFVRTEIHSLWRALEDAWDARQRWAASNKRERRPS